MLPRSLVSFGLSALVALTSACGAAHERQRGEIAAEERPAESEEPSPPTAPSDASRHEATAAPGPDAWLPRGPDRLAERITRTTRALLAAIDGWRSAGGASSWPPPREVVLLGLDLQRSVGLLAGVGDRRGATVAELPRALRPAIRAAPVAGAAPRAAIGRVSSDVGLEMRTRPPLPPDVLLGHYRDAARRFGVRWQMLAAVHFLETKFGRVVSSSWAGAQGPMQFIPSTWAAYGMGGDVRDPRDAIHGAANYLAANGAPHEPRRALWAYNPVAYYGEAVLRYERIMRRDPRFFYALYTWQVFVRTTRGVVQLTGPGADVRSST